jgi:hydroxymethylbilane synthase
MNSERAPIRLRLGTRGSKLARWQADWVALQLGRVPAVEVEICEIATQGDLQKTGPIASLAQGATQGVFTKEIQRALLDGRIDLAVHSLKDLPTEPVPGLSVVSVPTRASVRDAWISRSGQGLADLPQGAKVGTGSLRRRAQLLHLRGDLEVLDLRGNVGTRLEKLDDGAFDAIVLAEAGLQRLELERRVTQCFDPLELLPAVGQGALAIEARSDDPATHAALRSLDDTDSHIAVTAERALLAALRGGCLAPIGAWARLVDSGALRLSAVVLSADGRQRLFHEAETPLENVEAASHNAEAPNHNAKASPEEAEILVDAVETLGRDVAQQLLADGAAELIASSRGD